MAGPGRPSPWRSSGHARRSSSHREHPGIPPGLAFTCREEGIDVRCFLVQEFVEGETLAAAVAGGRRFTEERAASLLWQAASGARYLHRYSPPLVHGNIKPSTIILGKDGVLRLTDFSFPNLPRADEALPAPGTEELTSGYTPPEALEGAATPASDVFSLGMSVIYALSGEQPSFVGRAGGRPALPETARVADWLVRFLERMTDPAPAGRFQDGAELREALPVWAGRVRAGGKRFPWAVLAAGAGALLLGWLALAVPWANRRPEEPAAPPAPSTGSHAQAPLATHPAAPRALHGQAGLRSRRAGHGPLRRLPGQPDRLAHRRRSHGPGPVLRRVVLPQGGARRAENLQGAADRELRSARLLRLAGGGLPGAGPLRLRGDRAPRRGCSGT